MEQNVVLEMRDISKNFTGVRALSHVDFTLRKGEIHALMGENGAGKSTLIKVLTGVHEFESGTIHMAGNSNAIINHSPQEAQANGISTVYQEVNLCPNLTVAENLFIGREPRKMGMIDWKQMNERSGKLLESLDIHVPPTQMLEECSIAIQQMIAIARAVDMKCHVLILDEPTSSLDDDEVEKLFVLMRFRKGIHFIKGKEYKDGSGLLQVTVQVQPLLGTKKAELVRKCLDTYYKRNFYRNMETTWLRPGKNRISFIEENGFHVVFGQRCCNKKGEDVCGDTFSFTNFGRKRAVMLLSDGMGTGKKANEDSRRLIETLEDLLEAGISEEFALEMIQDALLFQDKGAFSTIDAAVISLKTGILKLLKAGGMATFIRHKNSVERIMPAALPPGCRIGQQFDLKYKKLYDGDMVIMVSDGMLEFENMPEISFRMESLIGKIKTNNAQVFANELIEAVPVLEDGYDDDRTVLVAAIWEKGTQKCGINIGRE